ncbi:uncharacterized protein TNCT_209711 [Trichonephila clavata]|uniref:Uncharacterized protein n=1 Tax=Trichonephila clavata TaxID=2740835 RepID=A0A8X6L9E0_TRICU|nr:uncharacterized protein TNCT_209711 [Trichonephila clavata]
MDANTVARLQDLSALLAKQTQDLQETLNKKTRQICQLKWELLHRDLSNVKQETEQHSHSAQKKRSKYAHWRSRSSEEPSVSNGPQKTDPANYDKVATDAYNISSSVDEIQATDLANTVQQLNKEVQKLTSATGISSMSCCIQDESMYTNVLALPKNIENSRNYKKSPNKSNSKRITVRRNSADNSSLVSTDDSRLIEEHSSSTHSDNSSDEYYSRVCCNSSVKSNFPNNSDTERLLMSYGEYLPRTQRKKKLQKISKLNSNFGRRRSNTFHTNRDLQKPTIIEHVPQKCHSFRVPREIYEGPIINRTPYIRRKHQSSNLNVRPQVDMNCKAMKSRTFQETTQFSKRDNDFFENYNNNFLREVASDSKIPLIMQIKKYADQCGEKKAGKLPTRSMSDKTKKEMATDKEFTQKKRLKKRLKSPDTAAVAAAFPDVGANSNIPGNNLPQNNRTRCSNSSQNTSKKSENELPKENLDVSQLGTRNGTAEVPTITIHFPKRKHRKPSHNTDDAVVPEEQSFTIVMPKKRSLSSECDSSISESSPREESKMIHSDKISSSLDSSARKDSTDHTNTDPHLSNSNKKHGDNSKGNIQLMKLVSLDNFDSPFDPNGSLTTTEHQQSEPQNRKRKADDGSCSGKNSPTEEMIDMITSGKIQSDSRSLTKSSTTELESGNSQTVSSRTNYIKSPSAPQLDWRKVCAKKISRSGAPNVRILIERYNQKLIESQTGKSPLSSNVSSPTTPRKISTPVNSSSPPEYIPHFSSTPNTPTSSPSYTPLAFKSAKNCPKTPPSSPTSLARSEALKKAKEDFIASSPQVSTPNSPIMLRTSDVSPTTPQKSIESPWLERHQTKDQLSKTGLLERTRSDEDRMSNCSMDSMSLVMLRAGENCRESRLPKKTSDSQKGDLPEGHTLKTSKSLSSSSLFKTVLHSDFKVPTNLLKLKRSKRKKDMSTVTELCRQSLLLTTEDTQNIITPASHKSCPSSPELKAKTVGKPNWLQRNIFRHK